MKWHINESGVPGVCTAKVKCRFKDNPHFESYDEAQEFIDNENEEILRRLEKSNKSTKSHLIKHADIDEILESKNIENQIANIQRRIDYIEDYCANKAYTFARRKNKGLAKKPFIQNFIKNHKELELLKGDRSNLTKHYVRVFKQREQSFKEIQNTKEHLIDYSFSRASSSSYILYKESSFDEVVKNFEKNGYYVLIRPNVKSNLEENFLVRLSDHYPKEWYRKGNNNINSVWEYTDASVLVTYKEPELPKYKDLKMNKEIKKLIELNHILQKSTTQ